MRIAVGGIGVAFAGMTSAIGMRILSCTEDEELSLSSNCVAT